MLDDKNLKHWNVVTELPMLEGGKPVKKLSGIARKREKLCTRIDEFWVYYQNPDKFSFEKKQKCPHTGQRETVFISGVWRDKYPIVQDYKNSLRIRLRHGAKFLPLTASGQTELFMPHGNDLALEDLLATLKDAVLSGQYDELL